MKKTFIQTLITACLLMAIVNPSAGQNKKPLRVFLIGNSFSQNASRFLPALSEAGGHSVIIGRAEIGGCSLQRHWDSVAVNMVDSNRGKAYNGKSLKQLLSEGTWDVVTIQQASAFSSDVRTYQPYARKLYDFIKQLQPNAKIVLHQTWAYRADAREFGRINGHGYTQTQKEMWTFSRAAYHTVADSLGIELIPVGDAFWKVASDANWGFVKDTSYDYLNPVYPDLPMQKHSLNIGYRWDKNKKLVFDANHANDAGCYLAGLVWYGFLFNADPSRLNYIPKGIDPDFASAMRRFAADALKEVHRK